MPSYEDALEDFEGLNTQVLGISVDSIPSHEAWQKSLGGITYPLLSDFNPQGAVTDAYGVRHEKGMSERALFIVDKEGIIRFIDVHPISELPENDEIFNELAKLENK
jgi:alkyl hydroperoxide reductase subunit AhpC